MRRIIERIESLVFILFLGLMWLLTTMCTSQDWARSMEFKKQRIEGARVMRGASAEPAESIANTETDSVSMVQYWAQEFRGEQKAAK